MNVPAREEIKKSGNFFCWNSGVGLQSLDADVADAMGLEKIPGKDTAGSFFFSVTTIPVWFVIKSSTLQRNHFPGFNKYPRNAEYPQDEPCDGRETRKN